MPGVIATGMFTTTGDPRELLGLTAAFALVAAAFLLFGLLMGALWATRRRAAQRGRHVARQPSARGRERASARDHRPQ